MNLRDKLNSAAVDVKSQRVKNDPFFKKLAKQFDKGMGPIFDREAKKFNTSIMRVENKLVRCEKKMHEYINFTENIARADMMMAEKLVNRELVYKNVMAQWTNYFLARSHMEQLDALTWGFARFSLNISMAWNDLPPKQMIQAGVHRSLVDLCKFKSELVVGPALMALVHISIHDEMKPQITLANVLATLIKLLVTSESKPILQQACRLVASLALHFPNKVLIANTGCIHGMLDLVLGTNKEINEDIAYAALTGITNSIYGNDANRRLLVDLKGIKPLLTLIQDSNNNRNITEAVKSLNNIAYCNGYTAGDMLAQGTDRVLHEVLNGGDIMSNNETVYMCLSTLSNLCYNSTTQAHVGSSDGIMETTVRILEYSTDLMVVGEAAMLCLACQWQNKSNKILCAGKDIIPALVKRIVFHSEYTDDENIDALEKCCHGLCSCLLYKSNHERFLVIDGLKKMVKICKQSNNQRIVAAVCAAIVCLVPSPDQLLSWHEQEFTVPVEKEDALSVLKKAKFTGFGHLPQPPDWLQSALIYLSLSDEGLRMQDPWIKKEFVDKMIFCKQFCTAIEPDIEVGEDETFRGLMFSVY